MTGFAATVAEVSFVASSAAWLILLADVVGTLRPGDRVAIAGTGDAFVADGVTFACSADGPRTLLVLRARPPVSLVRGAALTGQ